MRSTTKLYLLVGLLALLVGAGCSGNGPEAKAPETEPFETPPDPRLSTLEAPIALGMDQLEDLINRKVKGAIFTDKQLGKSKGLQLDLEKAGDIELSPTDDHMNWKVPLLIRVKGKRKESEKVQFQMVLHLASLLDLNTDWQLVTTTRLKSITWIKRPIVDFELFELDLTGFVENYFRNNQKELLGQIDQAILQNVNLKPTIEKVWNELQKPIRINKSYEEVWLHIRPEQIFQGPVAFYSDQLLIRARVTAWLKTEVGTPKGQDALVALPALMKGKTASRDFDLYLNSWWPYQRMNELLKDSLMGKTLEVEGHELKVKAMELSGSGQRLVLKLTTEGDVDGTLYLSGMPVFEPESALLRLQSVEFDVNTEDVFLSVADWLFHDSFKASLEKKLAFPIGTSIDQLPELIQGALSQGKLGERVNVSIDEMEVAPMALVVGEKGLHTQIRGTGQTGILMRKL
ncbi:MAG: DUF4403 family protein [Salibacteraceae bacterium]